MDEREGRREKKPDVSLTRLPQPVFQTLLVGPDNLNRWHAAFHRRISGRKAPQTAG